MYAATAIPAKISSPSHPCQLVFPWLLPLGLSGGGVFVRAPPLTSWGSHCLPGSSGSPVSPGKCFSGKWGRRRRRGGRRRTRSPKRCEFSRQPQDWASQTWNAQKVQLKQTRYTKEGASGQSTEKHWGTHGRWKQWQEICDAIVQG